MKRIVFIFLGLFSFMTMITNEHFCFDGQKALAQRMYAELDDVVIIGSASGGGSYNGGFGEPNDNSGYWDDLFGGSSDNGNNSENNDGDNSYVEPVMALMNLVLALLLQMQGIRLIVKG